MTIDQRTGTRAFYSNPSTHIARSQEMYFDIGYNWAEIPWNDIYTSGWMDAKPTHDTGEVWGTENQLVMSRKPEYFAPGNIVRSNVIPSINLNDPRYGFDRRDVTTRIF